MTEIGFAKHRHVSPRLCVLQYVSDLGAEPEVVASHPGNASPVAAPEKIERRPGEPLLASLDELVSEIRLLGGAVEASDNARSRLGD